MSQRHRMRVILSKKGFDSTYGGCPSPLIVEKADAESGTLLSLPIPQDYEGEIPMPEYRDLTFSGLSYDQIVQDLCHGKREHCGCCHLDPDIRSGIRDPKAWKEKFGRDLTWKPAFGQHARSLQHLIARDVQPGDLFLFFGWFKRAVVRDGHLSYVRGAHDVNAVYGYLQIGEIITDKERIRREYPWHPHALERYFASSSAAPVNALYVPTEHLVLDEDTGLPGYGVIPYSRDNRDQVLTKGRGEEKISRTIWELSCFETPGLSLHVETKKEALTPIFGKSVFQHRYYGQEFVIEPENDEAELRLIDWARGILVQA